MLLVVAGIAAVLLVIAGVLALLGQGSPASGPPAQNALIGTSLSRLPPLRPPLEQVGHAGVLPRRFWAPHGAVLLFFAQWCTACHHEVNSLARALGRGDVSGVKVLGVDGDQSGSVAAGFVAAHHVRFPVFHDGSLELAGALVPTGFPAAVFVKSDGKVVDVQYGALSVMQLDAGLSKIGKPR
jgi:hypothetical protein